MKLLAVACTVGAIFAGAVAATGTTGPSESATASASCTAEEKAAREEALRQYRQNMAAARKAYFRRVRDPKRRAAFVKRQRARLQALQTAAGCTVPPLPPSSGESCSFMFPANTGSFRFSEGPLSSDWLAPRGRVDAVMLFVDFPDAPANDNTISQLVARHTAHLAWFEEASYGRFSVSVTPVARWFRLPRPTSTYTPLPQSVHHPDVFADAVAAADGAVDFSRYQAVFVIGARGWNQGVGGPFLAAPGSGARADGNELRYGVVLGPSVLDAGGTYASNVLNHEFLHALGLPDIHGGDGSSTGWDPMNREIPTTHPFGWHKRLLGWLDPGQVTCLSEAGQLEETLQQLDTRGGKKLVVIPTSATTAYVVEVRRRSGYDRTICKEGVLVYTVDSLRPSAQGPITVKSAGTGCSPGAEPFGVGGVFADSAVTIEVLASDGDGFRIRATRK